MLNTHQNQLSIISIYESTRAFSALRLSSLSVQVTLLCFFIKLWANKIWTRQWAEIPTKISPLTNLYMETEATGEIVFTFRIFKQGRLVFNSQHLYFRGRESTCNAGASGAANWIPQLRRSPGEGNSNPLQHSCLGNPMDREAWHATVHGVTKSRTWLNNCTHTHLMIHL